MDEINVKAAARFINLDIGDDIELKEIVQLASSTCGAQYAFITFFDDETQHLKVCKGYDGTTRAKEETFCIHALEQNSLMIVSDALSDLRFAENTLVTGGLAIRFYAGIPLKTSDGQKIGTLCVLDDKSHVLNKHQQLVLKVLATEAMKVMELKIGMELLEKNQREVAEQRIQINDANIRLRSFFQSSVNFHVLLGKNGEVIDYNKTAYKFIKKVHKTAFQRGDLFMIYLAPEFVATFIDRYALALQGQKAAEEGSTYYEEYGTIWWEASFEPARDEANEIIGVSYVIRNVTERRLREQKIIEQNQSLLKIAHIQAHEFRGPLTTIMGLINCIKADDYTASEPLLRFLDDAVNNLDDKIKQIVGDIDQIIL